MAIPGSQAPRNSLTEDIKEYLTLKGVEWEESADLKEVASKCDVVYQTRIQKEHFGERNDLYEEARGKYIISRDVLGVMQKHAIVMHPLPRLDEITVDVDGDPRAAYFRQAKNGLYIRMALLKLLLVGCLGCLMRLECLLTADSDSSSASEKEKKRPGEAKAVEDARRRVEAEVAAEAKRKRDLERCSTNSSSSAEKTLVMDSLPDSILNDLRKVEEILRKIDENQTQSGYSLEHVLNSSDNINMRSEMMKFVRNISLQCLNVFPHDHILKEATLVDEEISNTKMNSSSVAITPCRTLAKSLLKSNHQDVHLCGVYARREVAFRNIEYARKVFDMALLSIEGLPWDPKSNASLLFFWYAELELELSNNNSSRSSESSLSRTLHIVAWDVGKQSVSVCLFAISYEIRKGSSHHRVHRIFERESGDNMLKSCELNSELVIPGGFLEWKETMDSCGSKMISAIEGPHLVAPTGSDLECHGKEDMEHWKLCHLSPPNSFPSPCLA
ncbi:unnamed protein product [Lactuca saligna]|uniref:Aspartate/ornithine carbamoyltransferase Asp/Orn-binding domain-containing protein n=1 Tax=Lactuca saligna TaxID=75948 RepID=A0AA35ZCI4_LACSI|nr:unnamed protein product [Lactuca saligna]